jgi:putative transposase
MASCKLQYLWRAVDQDGEVLDILVQPLCNKQAAKKFFRKLLKGLQYIPRAIITDKLVSYAVAKAEILANAAQRSSNRAENSYQPTRERDVTCEASSRPDMPAVLASFGDCMVFRPGRHLMAARNYRKVMRRCFSQMSEVIRPDFAGP